MEGEERSRPRRRGRYGLAGLIVSACAFLPLDPETGSSTVGVLRQALGQDWVAFVLLALTVGLPYLLGLFAAMASSGSRMGHALLRAGLCVMCFEATVLSLVLLRTDGVIAPLALVGFCVAMDLTVLPSLGRSGERGSARLARYTGAMLAGVYGWFAIQSVHHGVTNAAFIGTAIAGALLSLAAGIRLAATEDR